VSVLPGAKIQAFAFSDTIAVWKFDFTINAEQLTKQ